MTNRAKEMWTYYNSVLAANCEHEWHTSENSSGVIFLTCKKCFTSKIVGKRDKTVSQKQRVEQK